MLTYCTEQVQFHFGDTETTVDFRGETKRVMEGYVLVGGNNGYVRKSIDTRDLSVQRDMERFRQSVDMIIPYQNMKVILVYPPHAHATIAGHQEVSQLVLKLEV